VKRDHISQKLYAFDCHFWLQVNTRNKEIGHYREIRTISCPYPNQNYCGIMNNIANQIFVDKRFIKKSKAEILQKTYNFSKIKRHYINALVQNGFISIYLKHVLG